MLDNTAGGTATLAGNLGSLTASNWNVRVFTVGGSNVSITQQVMGLYENSNVTRNITWELYAVDGSNNVSGALLASDTQAVTLPGGGGASSAYYTFNTGGTLANYSLQAAQTYGLLFKSDATSTTLSWTQTSPNTVYAPSEGFSYVANRRTTNSGSSYSSNTYYNAWSMTTSGVASSVPEPTSLAMLGLCAAGAAFRSRKRLNASVKKALRRG